MKINAEDAQIKSFIDEMIEANFPYLKDKFEQREFMLIVIKQIWDNDKYPDIRSADGNVMGAKYTAILKRILEYKKVYKRNYIVDELTDESI